MACRLDYFTALEAFITVAVSCTSHARAACASLCCADTFTTVAEGCDLNPQGYYAHTVGFQMYEGVEVRLAKFEVCEPGSCFNPAAEAAKQRSAKKCTLPPRETGKTAWDCG
jgi:hypothetical protein